MNENAFFDTEGRLADKLAEVAKTFNKIVNEEREACGGVFDAVLDNPNAEDVEDWKKLRYALMTEGFKDLSDRFTALVLLASSNKKDLDKFAEDRGTTCTDLVGVFVAEQFVAALKSYLDLEDDED